MSEVLATSLCSTPKSAITSWAACKPPCMLPPAPTQRMSAVFSGVCVTYGACGQVLQLSDIGLQAQQVGQTQLTTASLRGPQWRKSSENPGNDSAKSSVPQQWLVNLNVFSSICYSAKLFTLASINPIRSIWVYYLHNSQDTLPSLWRTQFVTKKVSLPEHILQPPFNSLICFFIGHITLWNDIEYVFARYFFLPVLSNGI